MASEKQLLKIIKRLAIRLASDEKEEYYYICMLCQATSDNPNIEHNYGCVLKGVE